MISSEEEEEEEEARKNDDEDDEEEVAAAAADLLLLVALLLSAGGGEGSKKQTSLRRSLPSKGPSDSIKLLGKSSSSAPPESLRAGAANQINISGNELVVPWAGIEFSKEGEEIGQNTKGSGLIGQYQKQSDGSIAMEIVYPFDVASADMIYPLPSF